jgi:hypothetical protein
MRWLLPSVAELQAITHEPREYPRAETWDEWLNTDGLLPPLRKPRRNQNASPDGSLSDEDQMRLPDEKAA